MRTIKTRNTMRNIKILDKSVNHSTRMKDAFLRTKDKAEETQNSRHDSPIEYANDKVHGASQSATRQSALHLKNPRQKAHENFDRAKGHFQEVRRQMPKERKRAAEQAEKTAHKAKANADELQNIAVKAKDMAHESRAAVADAKNNLHEVRKSGRLAKGMSSPTKSIETSGISGKSTTRGFKQSTKGAVKTTKKSVKTAERSAKGAVKTAKRTAKTAHKTAQSAAKSARVASRAARVATKAAAVTAKSTVKAITAMVKIAIAAIRGLVALVAAGGWIAVTVILIICMIALLVGSVFGIFFSSEPSENGKTINSVIREIDGEYMDAIGGIISENPHDLLDMSGARAGWKEVLAVYTVKTVTDPDHPMEVATVDDEKADLLRLVFWDMNMISHSVGRVNVEEDVTGDDGLPTGETTTVSKTVLCITVSHKTPAEIAVQYGFNAAQTKQLEEILKPEYHGLWNALLYGVTSIGDGSMIGVAETQLGNIGGEPYWSWYGFTSRVEWCATFVSWVAEQCGFIDAGIIPKFSSCEIGIQWFKNKGQWCEPGYVPSPGDLIFFDWEGDGVSDHVGIVESVTNGVVNTIEGNTSDSVARRSYDLGSVKIYGYSTPLFQ